MDPLEHSDNAYEYDDGKADGVKVNLHEIGFRQAQFKECIERFKQLGTGLHIVVQLKIAHTRSPVQSIGLCEVNDVHG